jgi:uncharacterized RDD family membrane protein YckC
MSHRPADEVVLGLDNVPLEMPVASLGTRALAASIDYVLFGILLAGFFIAAIWVVSFAGLNDAWVFAGFILLFFVVEYGYFIGLEIAMQGQTPGKRVVGVRVVSRHAGRVDATSVVLRNLVRSVDMFVGVPFMAVDPLARRLGDRLAGTLVVHARRNAPDELLLQRVPRGFGPAETSVLEEYLRRAAQLQPDRARHLAEQLVSRIDSVDPDYLRAQDPSLPPAERLRRAALGG